MPITTHGKIRIATPSSGQKRSSLAIITHGGWDPVRLKSFDLGDGMTKVGTGLVMFFPHKHQDFGNSVLGTRAVSGQGWGGISDIISGGEAIHNYALQAHHNCDSDQKAQSLVDSGADKPSGLDVLYLTGDDECHLSSVFSALRGTAYRTIFAYFCRVEWTGKYTPEGNKLWK